MSGTELDLLSIAELELEAEDPLLLDQPDSDWVRAEASRKNGDFLKAGPYFYERWQAEHSAAAGWRYAFCLRKAGHAEAALRAAYKVARIHPEDRAVIQERVWCIYEARLKPALDAKQSGKVLDYAREMLDSGADDFATKLAVFAGIRAAKDRGQWESVLDWCGRLDPATLSTASRKVGEKKTVFSDRERYYFAYIKSLLQLSRWEEALQASESALVTFERNSDFQRWHAWSLAQLGDVEVAIRELETMRSAGRCRWYILADLSRLLSQVDRTEEAWKIALEAVTANTEETTKLGLYEHMARLAFQRGNHAAGVDHLGLVLAIRAREAWGVSAELERLLEHWLDALAAVSAKSPQEWKDRASAHWHSLGAVSATPRKAGTVTQVLPGRTYAFLKWEDKLVYVQLKDIPPEARREGAAVEFRLSTGYDVKKRSESERATDLKAVK